MKELILHNGHIKIYKRENSQYWQMRIKPPKQKAIRESSGCKSIEAAKEIALKINLKFIIIPPNLMKHKHIKLFYTSNKIAEIIANLLIKA